MSSAKATHIRLEPLDAEAEADALLREHDLERGEAKGSSPRIGNDEDDEAFKRDLEDLEGSESLPPSGQAIAAVPAKMHPAPIICLWIALSSSVILMNSWILKDLGFPFPIFLTTSHMIYATIGTRILRQFTHLLDDVDNIDMNFDRWLKNIVPIGALFSASLIFSNLAYLTLSVPFIQMLKAFTCVAVLTMSVLMGLDQFNRRTTITVCAISFGVAIASYGELDFALSGFIFQALGIMFEATRLVAIQKLLQGLRMDPLVSLYYFAPVCAGLNIFLTLLREGRDPFDLVMSRVGPATLFVNVNVALLLNIAVVFLIGCASSLVLTLSGVVKDILLVCGGVFLFGAPVSMTQVFGYAIALGGLVVFKTPADQMAVYFAQARTMMRR